MNASKTSQAAGSMVPILLAILLLTVLVFVTQERPSSSPSARHNTVPQPLPQLQSMAVPSVLQALSDATNELPQVVHGQNVSYSLKLPEGWKTQSIGMESVDNLSASQGNVNLAVMVQERKIASTDEAAAAALSFLQGTASELQSSKPEPLVIDGKTWLGFVVVCRVEKDLMAYQYYVYSGSEGTYQIVGWTPQGDFQRELPALRTIMRTFRFPHPADGSVVGSKEAQMPTAVKKAAGP